MKDNIKRMENLIFKIVKSPTKKADQYYFNIPIDFIRSGKIEVDKDYELLCFRIIKNDKNKK